MSLAPADSDALQFAVDSCGSGAGCTMLLSRPLDLPKPVVWNAAAGAFATARGMLRSARGGKGRLAWKQGGSIWTVLLHSPACDAHGVPGSDLVVSSPATIRRRRHRVATRQLHPSPRPVWHPELQKLRAEAAGEAQLCAFIHAIHISLAP